MRKMHNVDEFVLRKQWSLRLDRVKLKKWKNLEFCWWHVWWLELELAVEAWCSAEMVGENCNESETEWMSWSLLARYEIDGKHWNQIEKIIIHVNSIQFGVKNEWKWWKTVKIMPFSCFGPGLYTVGWWNFWNLMKDYEFSHPNSGIGNFPIGLT